MNAQTQIKEPQGKQGEYYTDMPVGEILRRARLHYGQSLNDVEAVLRIRAVQLGALEEGDIANLPARTYAIGFVRSYSEYLGLDGEKMVNLFKIQSVGNKARPELNFPVAASESKLPGVVLLGISGAAVIAIVLLFSLFHKSGNTSAKEDIPPVSANMKAAAQAPVPTALPVATATGAPSFRSAAALGAAPVSVLTIPGKNATRIVVMVKETTWVEIRNSSGKPLISQVLNPGEQYMVPNEEGLILATGNIGGLGFMVDGQQIAPLGKGGDVARGIKLDPAVLKAGAPKAGLPGPAVQIVAPAPGTPAGAATQPNGSWQSAIRAGAPTAAAGSVPVIPPVAPSGPAAAIPAPVKPAAQTNPAPPVQQAQPARRQQPPRRRSTDEAYRPQRPSPYDYYDRRYNGDE